MSPATRPPPPQPAASLLPDLLGFLLVSGLGVAIVLHGADAMHYSWQWYRVPSFFGRTVDGEFIPGPLLRGLGVTARIVALSMGITLVAGLVKNPKP